MVLSGDKTVLGDGTPGSGMGCSRCRGAAWKEQDHLRVSRNCSGRHPEAGASLGFTWAPELKRCPWSLISPAAWEYVHLWRRWKSIGVLPERGDLLDQPADIAKALENCEWTRIEVEAKAAEAAERKAELAAKRAGDSKKGR